MAERNTPEIGKKAPDFNLSDADGNKHSLKDYHGRKLVIYFYPKDDTPGCTTQACDFRDSMAQLKRHNVAVVGISPDSIESHAKFRSKYELPFTLLADPEKKTLAKYGAWGEKTNYGKTSEGVIRSSFLIDEEGKIEHVWPNVQAQGHVAKVMEKIDELVNG